MTTKSKNNFRGLTLIEVIISITILSLILLIVYSSLTLSRRSYIEGENIAEITQNGRVILERLSREIRQAKEIVTELPDVLDSEIPEGAKSEIEFEDGHISAPYHYIHYFKEDNKIWREVIGYYFSGDSDETLVPWDAQPPENQTLEKKTLEEAKIIGECVTDLKLWGLRVINTFITLEKYNKKIELSAKVFGRNL